MPDRLLSFRFTVYPGLLIEVDGIWKVDGETHMRSCFGFGWKEGMRIMRSALGVIQLISAVILQPRAPSLQQPAKLCVGGLARHFLRFRRPPSYRALF